jgi:ABC-type uncharacterized transport system ATPase subunit
VIEARDLTKRYGPVLAVDALSFDVRPGKVTGFLGPNGPGEVHHDVADTRPGHPMAARRISTAAVIAIWAALA